MTQPWSDGRKRWLSIAAVLVAVAASGVATVVSGNSTRPACGPTSCDWACGGSGCPWESPFIGSLSFPYCNGAGVGVSTLVVSEPSTTRGAFELAVTSDCNTSAGGSVERNLWAGLNSPPFSAWKPTGATYNVSVQWHVRGALAANATCGPSSPVSGPSAGNASVILYTTIDSFDYTLHGNPQGFVQSNWAVAHASCGGGTPPSPSVTVDSIWTQFVVGLTFHHGDAVSISADVGLDVFVYANPGHSRASGVLLPGASGPPGFGATLVSISIA